MHSTYSNTLRTRIAHRFYLLFLPAMLVASSLAAVARADEPLRWQWQTGQRWQVLHTHESSSVTRSADWPGQGTMTSSYEETYLWQVDAVDDEGAATLTITLQRVTMKTRCTLPGLPEGTAHEFDSDDPEAKSLPEELPMPTAESSQKEWDRWQWVGTANDIMPFIGRQYRATYSARGEILDAVALDDPDQPDTSDEGLRQTASIENELASCWLILPEPALEADDTWQGGLKLESFAYAGELQAEHTYFGVQEDNGRPLAVIVSALTPTDAEELLPKRILSGNAATLFDPAAGHLVKTACTVTYEEHEAGNETVHATDIIAWSIAPEGEAHAEFPAKELQLPEEPAPAEAP